MQIAWNENVNFIGKEFKEFLIAHRQIGIAVRRKYFAKFFNEKSTPPLPPPPNKKKKTEIVSEKQTICKQMPKTLIHIESQFLHKSHFILHIILTRTQKPISFILCHSPWFFLTLSTINFWEINCEKEEKKTNTHQS